MQSFPGAAMECTLKLIYNAIYPSLTTFPSVYVIGQRPPKLRYCIYASAMSKGVLDVVDLFLRYRELQSTPGYELGPVWPERLLEAIRSHGDCIESKAHCTRMHYIT
jgi:hypothetical protein